MADDNTQDTSIFGDVQDSEVTALRDRWREAKDRCQTSLSRHDQVIVASFESPQDLQADLEERRIAHSSSYGVRLISCINHSLPLLQQLSAVMVHAISGSQLETALIWGLLHLVITASIASDWTLTRIVAMLDKINKQLRLFAKYSKVLNDVTETRYALVDLFVAMIHFWTETVKVFASNQIQNVASHAWPNLNKKFEDALKQMENAVKEIQDVALFSKLHISEDSDAISHRDQMKSNVSAMLPFDEECTQFPCDVLGPADQYFYGRHVELKAIEDHLDAASLVSNPQCCTIYGLGGVGKTSVALAYAHSCRRSGRYDAIFWIHAETSIALKESFTDISLRLKLPGARRDGDHFDNIMRVKNWFNITRHPFLLIFDNVNDPILVEDHLPSSGSVLVTTRRREVAFRIGGNTEILELRPFSKSDGKILFSLLKNRERSVQTTADEDEALDQLIRDLDGLALGIQQMAAYISYRRLSVITFSELYDKEAESIHKNGKASRAQHTLATVWSLSFQEVKDKGFDVYKLLGVISVLSPDGILLRLFDVNDSSARLMFDTTWGTDYKIRYDNAVDFLLEVALIRRDDDMVSIHRLVQKAFRYTLSGPEFQEVFDAASALVNSAFPKQINGVAQLDKWEICHENIQHALSLAEVFMHSHKAEPLRPSPEFQELLKNSVWHLYEKGQWNEALQLLDIAEKACPEKESLVYAHLKNSAGVIYHELNDFRNCKIALETSRRIRENLLPETHHPELMPTYTNLGNVESSLGNFDEAFTHYSKVEEARRGRPELLISYGLTHLVFGRALFFNGDFAGASLRYDQAELIFLKTLGATSPLMGALIYARGNLELARGDIVAAGKLFGDGFSMAFQDSPTRVLTSAYYYKLGVVASLNHDVTKAMEHLEKAKNISEHHKLKANTARIIYRQAITLGDQRPLNDADKKESERLRFEASRMRMEIIDADDLPNVCEDEDQAYDALVCGFFR